LLNGVQGAEKVFSKFTYQFASDEKKFTLMSKKFASEVTKHEKKFTLLQKSLHFCKKVCMIYKKMTKKLTISKPV
jgi:hypothetical protein